MRKPTPMCFSSKRQFRDWVSAARMVSPGLNGYCADCTAQYQSRMISEGRCEYPGTTFKQDKDGFIGGIRPASDKRAIKNGEKE